MSTDVRTIAITRIETLAEAIENLAVGIAAKQIARSKSADGTVAPILNTFVVDAQAELRKALGEYVKPLARLVEGGPVQEPTQLDPGDALPVCTQCLGHLPCNHTCRHWAEAIRKTVYRKGDIA